MLAEPFDLRWQRLEHAVVAKHIERREADGRGRLVAAVFADYSLSPEIPLGAKAMLEPQAAGQLFLRCTDAWTELGDNDGEISVTIRRAE